MLTRSFIFALVLCVFGLGAQAAHVQGVSSAGTSSGTSVTFPSFTAIGTGDCVVGVIEFHQNINSVSNIQVGSTSATLLDFNNPGGATYSIQTFILCNITGSPTTITLNFNTTPAGTDHYLLFDEYSQQLAADGHTATNGNSSSSSLSPSVTTTVNGDTIWTHAAPSTTVTTPGGFTPRVTDNTNHIYSADEKQGTAGAVSATWNWTSVGATTYASMVALTPPPCIPGSLASLGSGAC